MQKCLITGLFLVILMSGCSNLDFSRGPINTMSDALDSGKPFVKEDSKAAEKARLERLSALLAEWQKQRTKMADEDYLVGVDDIVDIEILSIEQPGVTSKFTRTVDKDGKIVLPLLDRIGIVGLTEIGVRDKIAAAYDKNYLKNPQLIVKVREYRSAGVVITGAVQKPGITYLQKNVVSVLDVLSMAGGLSSTAGDKLYISRGLQAAPATGTPASTNNIAVDPANPAAAGSTNAAETATLPESQRLVVDLKQLIEEGDIQLNVPVKSGDIITVPPRIERYVYVLGYVQRPGPITLRMDQPLRALNALAMAGGLTYQGRAEKSYLIRDTESGGKTIIDVDLTKVARGVRPDVDMKPGDTLVIGSGFLMKMMEFIRPSATVGASITPTL
jgi:polysaccharide export outer membrane protein